ncbi:chemotaxis protein CheB [uncultured Tateyamaria sp.]|uniref:chemotaxis protein CheB n=1 Tax=uncultured Tateyamaria sp. TaxID=455651 RepID=UPI00260A5B9B|nr:chemotaxis protein CheB [uncultured Tateyamaria sp.]
MTQTDPTRAETPIIGIGASAGGLDALKSVVAHIPANLGACFVIVQHLSPDQDSILDQLLQPVAPVPVTQIEDGEIPRPDHVYMVPPGVTLHLTDGRFKLTKRSQDRGVFRPIDMFFRSLAEAQGRDAYCVVLSGTGTDGSDGVRAVKSAGGFALVQESTGARFPGMPDSAVATGLVDFVLPARQIPVRLHEIIMHRRQLMDDTAQADLRSSVEAHLPQITAHLADVAGNDFSRYKPGTLVRRIERRMALLRVQSVAQFIEVLTQDDMQAELLAQDFLIGVTKFFRDPETWAALRTQVVRPLLARDQTHIRVWVPGCSTGEEAYTVAMLFLEEMEAQGAQHALQVFGTDIDTAALFNARHGLFAPASMSALSDAQRARFFSIENGQYRAVPFLRDCCVFAPHNLIQDPPFSRLDLISCRNLMIYLSAELQARVVPRLHFALREGGHLLLGPSEGVGDEDNLFLEVDRTHRIFAKNDEAVTRYSALSDPKPRARTAHPRPTPGEIAALPGAVTDAARQTIAEREYLSRFAAPYALVTGSGDIVFLSEGMTAFVAPKSGVPSSNIDAYLRPELRLPVRNALKQARARGGIIEVQDVMLDDGGSASFVDVHLGATQQDDTLFLIRLNRVRSLAQEAVSDAVARRETRDQDMLEAENFSLRRQLSAILQEHEASSQELKNTNEELLSMNEELQSSNEELETSREELQSINEELETVNAELQENNRLLTRVNSDLKNLFESTDVAVLFLDRNFCVRNFTPTTTRLFGIRRRDIGRPISDLSSRMDYPGLAEDAAKVDDTLQPLEREIGIDASGETYLLRIRPYRTTENLIDGYVLSFFDITSRKQYEDTLQRNQQEFARQYAELENLYDTTPVGLALVDTDFRWMRINESLAAINGYPVDAHIGKSQRELLPEIADKIEAAFQRVIDTREPVLGEEVTGETQAEPGVTRHWIADYYPVSADETVFAIGACVREVTDQKRLQAELEESRARLQRLFDASPVFVAITEGPNHVYTYSNPPHDAICGHRELIGKSILDAIPELKGQGVIERFDQVYDTGETLRIPEFKAVFDRDGDGDFEEGWFVQTLEPIRDGNGDVSGVASFTFEISDAIEARDAAEASDAQKTLLLGELEHRVKNTLATINAISKLLLKGTDTAADYQKRLSQRLQAIGRTHNLLTGVGWTGASLDQLVTAELAPYASDGPVPVFERQGPDVALDSSEALSLGMALHELTTNAAKYGALSVPDGKVVIASRVDAQEDGHETVTLTWHERNGPKIKKAPDRSGFGSLILEKVLARDLSADVKNDFAPDGLIFEVSFVREMPA